MNSQETNGIRERLTSRSLTLSKSFCILAGAISILAAAGWIFGIELLTRIHPALPAMQPNTAAALVLGAVAIVFTQNGRDSEKDRLIACAIAAVVSLIGLLTLCEYVFSWDLGLDGIFIRSADTLAAPLYPGRPSPQTAANFAMLGAALLIFNSRVLSIRIGQACALVVGANAVVALTGYIFSTSQFYGFPPIRSGIGMAVHTAASFILLALGLLCSRPNDGMMSLVTSDTQGGAMGRRILLTGVLAPLLIGALTRIGVYANWYGAGVQVSLFAVVIVALILRTTWQAARQSEQGELRARAALDESQTANERLQKALDERRVFAALIENSSDFIGIADPGGKAVYLNPAGRRMVGLPANYSVEDTTIADYYHPDERAFVSDVILRSMLEHGHWQGETYFRHWQTQKAIPVSDEHFMIRDPGTGRVLGMGTVTRDISDIKRSQDQLRQSEERFDLALRGADLGAWDWNIKTDEVIFNPKWAEMRGFGLQEIKPHVDSWSSGVHPDDWPRVQKSMTDYFQGLIPEYEAEFRALTKSGDWIWILDRGKVFARDEKGQPLRMVGTELDITQRKRLEEELRSAIRTREDVLAIVSHDLLNPLGTIQLVAELFSRMERIEVNKAQDFVGKIQRSIDEMRGLIGDLLDFAKIQSGTFSVVASRDRLSRVVIPMIDGLRAQAEAKRQTLEVDLPSELPEVAMDARRIGQVISNLVRNAIKFTPREGTIRISARQQEQKIVVSVTDTGPGIPQEHLLRIFDRFWQAPETKELGSGLGLSIAKGIVEAHGGTIWAESQIGKGSSFFFTMPLDESDNGKRTDAA